VLQGPADQRRGLVVADTVLCERAAELGEVRCARGSLLKHHQIHRADGAY
jgi:hypothetical protein